MSTWSWISCKLTLALLLDLTCCYGVVAYSDCGTTININRTAQLGCSQTNNDSLWICGEFQSALNLLSNIERPRSSLNSTNNYLEDCVLLLIPDGEAHYITTPLFLGGISIHFVGISETEGNRAGLNGSTLQLPSIICDYAIDVDLNRIFDLDYKYEDYVLYFNRSKAVSFRNIELVNCPYPIRLNTVDQVDIHNSLFRGFSEAVFDLYNNRNISITYSTFHDNQGTGISRYAFRGNTGAVAIGFNGVPVNYSEPKVFIFNCNFTRNSATASSLFRSSSGAFFNQAFSGRGGGVGVFFNEDVHNVSITITDSLFLGNYAQSFGGAVFLVVFNEGTHHTMDLERNVFKSNSGRLGGGAVQVTYISNGIAGEPHTASFIDCLFQNNSGPSGGAVYVYPAFQGGDGNLVIFRRCHFLMNQGLPGEGREFGSAVAISYSNFFRNKESLPRYEFTDCIFERNSGSNGVVSIAYAPVTFNGNNTFMNNTGTSALRIVGSLVEFYGSLSFVHNYVGDVAALHLLSLGQVRLTTGLNVEFFGNSGRYGASILVETPVSIAAFQNLAFNPQCFVLNQTPDLPPSNWTDVSIKFRRNNAVLASSLYISHVDSCSWSSLSPPFFDPAFLKQWPIWDFGNDSKNTGFEDPYSINHYVETAAHIIESVNDSVTFWPGHKFNLHLTGWDEFNHPTFVSARFFALTNSSSNKVQNTVSLHPPLVITDSNKQSNGHLSSQYTLTYAVNSVVPLNNSHEPLANVRIDVPFQDDNVGGVITDSFVIYPDVCPVGYTLRQAALHSGYECRCQENTQQILNCEDDQDTILIQSGYWGAPYTNSNQYDQGLNHFYPCPAGYCRCSQETSLGPSMCIHTYTISQPDAQCVCNRSGVLCGECEGGYGVSALLSNCVTCNDAYSLLIVILVIVDVILFALIVLWDKALPCHLYPFIFYLQVAPYVGQYFPSSFEIVGKFLVFIGSALSFYFPYDFCLYGNMSPLMAYFLRYIPILIAMAMAPLLFILRRKRFRVLEHYGLWSIVLLLYTPVVHTSVSILNCPYIDTVGEYRWFVDGSIECFAGWHAPLGILAIVMLLLCFALIPLTIVIALNKYPKRGLYWLRNISTPLKESYKEDLKWWFGVELGRRLLILLLIVPLPVTNAVPLLIVCILVAVCGLFQPYKSMAVNILEICVLSNFLLLLMLQSTQLIKDTYVVFPLPVATTESNLTTSTCQLYSGISTLAWIMFPFYYLPLLGLVVVIGVVLINYLRAKIMWHKKSVDLTSLERINSSYITPSTNVRSVSVRIGRSQRRATHGVAATRSHLLKNNDRTHEEELMSPELSPTSSTVF